MIQSPHLDKHGTVFVPAAQYAEWIADHPDCIALIITPNEGQLRMIPVMLMMTSGMHCFVTPVTSTDSRLVEAVRVPRVRMYKEGVMVANTLVSQTDTAHFERVLKAMCSQ